MSAGQRSAMLAALESTKQRLADARAEALAARLPVVEGAPPQRPAPTAAPAEGEAGAVAATPAAGNADFLTFADPSAARAAKDVSASASVQQRAQFIDSWATKLEEFVFDDSRRVFELPTELSGFDRKTLHQLATHYNLSHHSSAAAGGLRRLVLRKDNLFFARAAQRADQAALEGLKSDGPAPPGTSRRRQTAEADRVPEKEQFADRAAYKAFRKLRKATDEYAYAVETGLTEEDIAALRAAEDAEGGGGSDGALTAEAAGETSAWGMALQGAEEGTGAADGEFAAIAAAGARGELFEVCSDCGAKNKIDYDPRRWECVGPCEACARDTIWRLETTHGASLRHKAAEDRRAAAEELRAMREDDDAAAADVAGRNNKRERDDGVVDATADPRVESRTKLSVEELADLAAMHELPEADVKWVGAFARSRDKQGATDDHVLFCTDFGDMAKYVPAAPAGGETTTVFAFVEQEAPDAPVSKRLNRLLATVEKSAAAGSGTATRDVYVGFPAFIPDAMCCVVAIIVSSERADEATVKLAAKDVAGPAIRVSTVLADVLVA